MVPLKDVDREFWPDVDKLGDLLLGRSGTANVEASGDGGAFEKLWIVPEDDAKASAAALSSKILVDRRIVGEPAVERPFVGM